MDRILMGVPILINGPEGAWKRRDHAKVELFFDEPFIAESQHQGFSFGFKVFDTWLPLTQWEELCDVSVEDALHFMDDMNINRLSQARDELSLEDNNIAVIPIIIEGESGFNAFMQHYFQKYGYFAFPSLNVDEIPMPEMIDDDDNVVEADAIYLLPMIFFELYENVLPVSLFAQSLYYDGGCTFDNENHRMSCRYMTPSQWVEKTVTLNDEQFLMMDYFHHLLETEQELTEQEISPFH